MGTNVSLIAPVTLGAHSLVAAGSVITENVPANALAIAREKQVIKENYASVLKERYAAEKAQQQQITVAKKTVKNVTVRVPGKQNRSSKLPTTSHIEATKITGKSVTGSTTSSGQTEQFQQFTATKKKNTKNTRSPLGAA